MKPPRGRKSARNELQVTRCKVMPRVKLKNKASALLPCGAYTTRKGEDVSCFFQRYSGRVHEKRGTYHRMWDMKELASLSTAQLRSPPCNAESWWMIRLDRRGRALGGSHTTRPQQLEINKECETGNWRDLGSRVTRYRLQLETKKQYASNKSQPCG